jgi:hypothetical protein
MMNYFAQLFSDIMDRLLGRSIFEKKTMMTMNLSDVLTRDSDLRSIPEETHGDFKRFLTIDDYNREFLSIFETYRRDIILDFTQKDGHFRV